MDQWVSPDRLFDGRDVLTGKALRLVDGRVVDMDETPAEAIRVRGMISPGYVDLQVNGGGGAQLNDRPTVAAMDTISAAHRQFGTVALLPTVITDAPDVLEAAAEAAIGAKGREGVAGLHIEGPHISLARRGTHAPGHVRPFEARTLDTVARLRKAGVAVMITLAPEAATMDDISALAGLGAIVSLGHTDADAGLMRQAIEAGATCATHLFNAMSPMVGRAPGAVGTIINSDCYSGIICDGHHVADEMVGMAIRARPVPDRMFLVSDAMATVGGPDHFELYGKTITLQNGRLVNAEGSLAGAHVTQAEGVKRLVDHTGTSLTTALRMATSIPATCIRRPELGKLAGRPITDLIVLNDDLTVRGDLASVVDFTLDEMTAG